jgi:hypothetical protein
MHIILTQQELKDYIQRYLNIPSDVEVTVSIKPEDTVKEPQQNTDGWVVNTQTQSVHPPDLEIDDSILVMYTDGDIYEGVAASWYDAWDITNNGHIVKYRKI